MYMLTKEEIKKELKLEISKFYCTYKSILFTKKMVMKLTNQDLLQFNLMSFFFYFKLRSHRAYGRETDKKSFHLFVSGRIRFMSVSNLVNPFIVR